MDQLLAYVRPFYPTWDEALSRKLQDDLGLTAQSPLRALSRDTRMKAALLASLAYRPELVVLDEPFTGLDPLVRDELIRALLELLCQARQAAEVVRRRSARPTSPGCAPRAKRPFSSRSTETDLSPASILATRDWLEWSLRASSP